MSFPPGRRSLALGIVALAVGLAALWASSSAPAALPANSSALAATSAAPSYLFSIPSAGGSLTGRNDQHLTLRLTGARRYLTRFTDAPLRQAAVVANVDFARRFASYFADAEPNAVLTYTPAHTQIPVSVVVTVGQPRWDARRATWTFPATRIRKKTDTLPGTTVHIKPPVIPNPRSFKHGTLLIDDAASGGGCTEGDIDYFPTLDGDVYLRDYVVASGELLSTAQNSTLFSIIGTTFGGDGHGTFALPNLPDFSGDVWPYPSGSIYPYVCYEGLYPSQEVSPPAQCLAGNIQLTSDQWVRPGWLAADGRRVAGFPALYSQIGTRFGGDGINDYALPTLDAPPGLRNIICADGTGWTPPSAQNPSPGTPYQCTVGEVNLFATTSSPANELPADGRSVPIGQAPELFASLGTTFGGDGLHTFGLPDPPVPLKGTSWSICDQGVVPTHY
jgi:microcystin-dependent protein